MIIIIISFNIICYYWIDSISATAENKDLNDFMIMLKHTTVTRLYFFKRRVKNLHTLMSKLREGKLRTGYFQDKLWIKLSQSTTVFARHLNSVFFRFFLLCDFRSRRIKMFTIYLLYRFQCDVVQKNIEVIMITFLIHSIFKLILFLEKNDIFSVILASISAICPLLMYFISKAAVMMTLFPLILALGEIGGNILVTIVMELFPTAFR